MKKVLFAVLLVTSATLTLAQQPAQTNGSGKTVPDKTLTMKDVTPTPPPVVPPLTSDEYIDLSDAARSASTLASQYKADQAAFTDKLQSERDTLMVANNKLQAAINQVCKKRGLTAEGDKADCLICDGPGNGTVCKGVAAGKLEIRKAEAPAPKEGEKK